MDFDAINTQLLERLQEAGKVLHMDQSHSSIQQKIQAQLALKHRTDNPDGSYYDYPMVHDTYGDAESGQVVHGRNKNFTLSKYKKSGDNYTLSDHKKVKPAYVTVPNDAEEQKESSVFVDGIEMPLAAKESEFATDGEIIDIRESCFDANGMGTVKLIAPGQGSSAYYSAEMLKEATSKGVFDNAQMFIDHATEDEEASRPEGSVKGLAAKGSKATYQEAGPEGPGVYTQAKAYPDVAPFLNARAKDIGMSIRALGRSVMGQVGGKVTKIAKSIDVLKSADFVTRAGAGGKLVPLLESFRESNPGNQRPPAAPQEKDMAKVEIEESELIGLRESAKQVPVLQLKIDRNDDRFNRMEARDHATAYLKESTLAAPAQARILKMVMAPQYTLPVKEGVLDVAGFTEALKALVTDEAAYLKESGAGLKLVTALGDGTVLRTEATDNDKKFQESQATQDKEYDSLIGNMSGIKSQKGAA